MLAGRLKLGGQVLAVAVVAGLLALLGWHLANPTQVPKGAAPDFVLSRLNGAGKLDLTSLRGKAVVLNFWASWCVPCKQEAHDLEAGWQRWRGQDVVFLGVDSEDWKGDGRKFASHYGLTYPLVVDGSGKTKNRYGVTGYPETFFIDRTGKIVGHHEVGPVDAEALNTNIRRALKS